MNISVISIIVIVIILFVGVKFYFSDTNQSQNNKSEEITEHNDNLEIFEISPGTTAKKIQANEDIVILDVRTPEEYEELHIKNAALLPVQELSQETLTAIGLGEDSKEKEIILYCRSGGRSKTAYTIMKSLGYTNVKSVAGGMIHWEEDKYPFTEVGKYTGQYVDIPQSEVVVVDGPVAVTDRVLHDFGLVPQFGGLVETTFVLTNKGSETLVIGDMSTSCACTSVSISDAKIEPNNESVITIVFNPNLHEEPLDTFKRTAFIPTNDPNNSEVELSIEVDIDEGK